MKNILIIALLIFATACNSSPSQPKTTDTVPKKATGIQYTCPMHPAVIANKPGTCPKCGMELVEKDDSK